ncbi:hypothetical protein KC19_VG101700, partial [Ceratodon purpureus]
KKWQASSSSILHRFHINPTQCTTYSLLHVSCSSTTRRIQQVRNHRHSKPHLHIPGILIPDLTPSALLLHFQPFLRLKKNGEILFNPCTIKTLSTMNSSRRKIFQHQKIHIEVLNLVQTALLDGSASGEAP